MENIPQSAPTPYIEKPGDGYALLTTKLNIFAGNFKSELESILSSGNIGLTDESVKGINRSESITVLESLKKLVRSQDKSERDQLKSTILSTFKTVRERDLEELPRAA